MGIPSNKVDYYRMRYPKGSKLRIIKPIDDPYSPKKAGDILNVEYIDDACQVHGHWDSGGSLAIIIGVDEFEIVAEGE